MARARASWDDAGQATIGREPHRDDANTVDGRVGRLVAEKRLDLVVEDSFESFLPVPHGAGL